MKLRHDHGGGGSSRQTPATGVVKACLSGASQADTRGAGGSTVLAVLREPEFSPGMVEQDAAILRAAAERVERARGQSCPVVPVSELERLGTVPAVVLSMAEGETSLALLEALEARGALVINGTRAVRATRRAALLDLARPRGPLVEGALVSTDDGDLIPPSILAGGAAWVKRADYHALGPGDVVRADARDVKATLRAMHARGIPKAVVQPHLSGTVVKFYGVLGPGRDPSQGAFFRTFVTEKGAQAPDAACIERLGRDALAAALQAGLSVFGGDAVLSESSTTPVVIDLNAWPSFWRCRDDAADAIASLALARVHSSSCKESLS